MAGITSELKSLKDLLDNDHQFRIPDFQRDFVWTQKEINVLFDDFREDTREHGIDFKIPKKDLQGYLLGNIVLVSNADNTALFDVIDGQQRLITLTLLFHALWEKINKLSTSTKQPRWSHCSSNLIRFFMLINDQYDFADYKIAYIQPLDFTVTYKSIINPNGSATGCIKNSINCNNINDVYATIEEEIDKIAKNPDDLKYFYDYITEHVKLIVTTAPSIESAFQLFEILNNRGKSLEPMDLLKNHLLKLMNNFNAQQNDKDTFVKKWNEFIKYLKAQGNGKSIDKSTFVRHFILGTTGEKIPKKKLFEYYKKLNYTSSKEILDFVDRLAKASKIYSSIEKSALSNEFLNNNDDMYIMFELLGTQQIHSLLIPFYDAGPQDKEELVAATARYVASVVFSFESPNKIEKDLPTILEKVLQANQSLQQSVKIAISEIKSHTNPYVNTIHALLPSKNFSTTKNKHLAPKALQILKFIELKINKNNSIKNNSTIELEHIMPFKASYKKYNFNSEDERVEYLNHLGNLTLLDQTTNQSAGKLDFNLKVPHYKNTGEPWITICIVDKLVNQTGTLQKRINFLNNTLYNSNYIQCRLWNKTQIDDRSTRIVNLLEKILLDQMP